MNSSKNNKLYLFGGIVLIVGVGIFLLVSYFFTTFAVKINYENVSSVMVRDEEYNTVATITSSGQSLRLSKDMVYDVVYTGNEGYLSGEMPILSTESEVNISPEYTTERLNKILDSELSGINKVIESSVENIVDYSIERGELFKNGSWYVTYLAYKQPDSLLKNDYLVVALRKTSENSWSLEVKPDIVFNKARYPNISLDIIDHINEYSAGVVDLRTGD